MGLGAADHLVADTDLVVAVVAAMAAAVVVPGEEAVDESDHCVVSPLEFTPEK